MLVDGFLAFLDSTVEVGFTQIAAVPVAYGIERNLLRKVVPVAFFLLQRPVDISHGTIIIGIVSGIKGMPPPALRRILLRRASRKARCNHSESY